MQRLTKQLTKDEEEEFFKMKKDVEMFDDNVQKQCLQYFLQYRSLSRISYDKVGLAFRCAYFMAEKSQSVFNINGEKTRGYSFSLNRLIKNYKLDDTMMLLKDFSKKVVIEDVEASSDLSAIIKEISFLITFYSKFERTTQKLEFKQRNNQVSYVKTFTSYAWLLYVKAKNEVLNRSLETISNTCLLAHILCTMIIYGWEFVRPLSILKEDKRISNNSSMKQVRKIVKQKILGIFLIKNVEAYQEVAFSFQNFLNEMINKAIISMNNEKADFLSPHRINNNYQRLDDYYRKSLNPEHLDERIFFKERTVNYTPSKFTPFARQNHNKKVKPKFGISNPTKDHQSFRTLNYDIIQKQTEVCENVPVKDIKLPKGIVQSPSMVVVPFVCSTPTTASMEMYNYLTEKSRKLKDLPLQQRQFDKQIFGLIDHVFENEKIDQQETKKNMIVALYKVSSWQYLHGNSGDKETDQLLRAFLSLCIELVFYTSNVSLTFDDIQRHIEGQPFELWKAIDHFHRADKRIPTNLKYHLLDLETELISEKIWTKNQIVNMLVSISNNFISIEESHYVFIDKLFRRVLHHIGFRIKQITDLLNVDEEVSEKIFETMKETLISHEQLLFMRHLDQLILCAIFSNCRRAGYETKFNNIKQVYEESNPNLKSSIENIICNVYIGENEKPLDIIKFYNNYYLNTQNLKKFIQGLYDGKSVKYTKKNNLLMSPLKAIIPKDINFRQKPKIVVKGNITPQPQALYAYNESPILKYELNAFKGKNNLKSKRVLDFDLQETVVKPKPEQIRTPTQTMQTQQVQVAQFFNKKIMKKAGQKENGNVKTPPSSHTPISSHRSSHVDMIGNQKVEINGFKIKAFKR